MVTRDDMPEDSPPEEPGPEAREGTNARELEELIALAEGTGLHHDVLERYLTVGKHLLADPLPSQVDPRLAKDLEPLIGRVDHVRVHTGSSASSAAKAMDARAFAIGDSDVFIDQQHYDTRSPEGRALLAHELAHTQDVSAGFALSSQRTDGPADDREAFAEAIEGRVFALEDTGLDTRQADTTRDVFAGAESVGDTPIEIDRDALAQRVFELLEAQHRHGRDRHGG